MSRKTTSKNGGLIKQASAGNKSRAKGVVTCIYPFLLLSGCFLLSAASIYLTINFLIYDAVVAVGYEGWNFNKIEKDLEPVFRFAAMSAHQKEVSEELLQKHIPPTKAAAASPREHLMEIPMADIKEGILPPPPVGDRPNESEELKQLRATGYEALTEFGEELRDIMSFFVPELVWNRKKQRYPQLQQWFRSRLHRLAPWLKGDHHKFGWPFDQFPLSSDTNSKAIVVCAGDKQFRYLDALMHTIRTIHHSDIAVYIAYRNDEDLSPPTRETLQSKYGTKFVDLSEKFDVDKAQLKGWDLKPFGALAIPETEVAIMDADVLLLRPPEDLFQLESYKREGTLFFHDRAYPEGLWTTREFLLHLQPDISETSKKATQSAGFFHEHVQESGIILIDKARRFKGLWASCLLIGRWDVRRFGQRDLVYGDKEFYHSAYEAIHEPYAFARYFPGVIGNIVTNFKDKTLPVDHNNFVLLEESSEKQSLSLCGRLLHVDDNRLPLWSNGGYMTKDDDRKTKHNLAEEGLGPFFFVDGGDSDTEKMSEDNQVWKWHGKLQSACLRPNQRWIQPVPEESAKKGQEAVAFYFQSSSNGG